MKTILLTLIFGTTISISAQSIERQVLGSTGGTFSSSSITVTSTVGETAVATFSGSLTLTQGYQQADTNNSTSIHEITVKASYSLYPNPTTGKSNLAITTENSNAEIQILIYSAAGKLISTGNQSLIAGTTSRVELDLSIQAAGVYFIKIKDANNHISKTLRVIKQ